MRAGKLDHEIIIQRASVSVNDAGNPQLAWTTLATLRAEIVEHAVNDVMRDQGSSTEEAITFHSRYFPGVTVADRLTFEGKTYTLKAAKEIGRRRGLELRAEKVGR
jgi:SPP1 family predicted phage head-tail adaptor